MTRPHRVTFTALATALLLVPSVHAARAADTVVQVPMGTLLDKRSVTVLQGTTIVPFNLTIDGGGTDTGDGGLQNGFATQAVAKLKSPGNVANSLPDDGHFLANTRHPEVVLHFSNDADATAGQNHMVNPVGGTFSFPMPAATYSKVFLFFHGADGGTTVTMTLTYSDATTQVAMAPIPDFFSDPTDPMVFILAPNLAKWSKTTTIAEANHHNIFGIEVDPMPGKTLMSIQVDRKKPPGYLVFWGATGIATSAVSGLDGGTGGGTDGGADAATTGAGGGGGTTATGGTSGTTGAAGSAVGGAGVSGGGAGSVGGAGVSGGGAGVSGGAGSSGAAGSTGTTGAAGSVAPHSGGGSGCRLAGEDGDVGEAQTRGLWLVLGVAGAWRVGRSRRRRPTTRA